MTILTSFNREANDNRCLDLYEMSLQEAGILAQRFQSEDAADLIFGDLEK